MSDYDGLVDEELLSRWNDMALPFTEREKLVKVMQERDLYPRDFESSWEATTGAYPDIADPEFLQKLLARREFADSYQSSWRRPTDPCTSAEEFELTSVQKFIANFMSPRTPYRSALLYHGTGVGKTCSAIQVAEQYLAAFPNRQVIILAPKTIRGGFIRQIFDIDRVIIGEGDEPNTTSQCTGSTYLELANCLYERDPAKIEAKVRYRISRRYKIMGYLAFALEIDGKDGLLSKIPARIKADTTLLAQEEARILGREYNGRLIIVDEAHNLRDAPAERDKEVESPGGIAQQTDEAEGKVLTPIIRKLFDRTEDMRLLMMTATPMYNNYTDVIFLLDLILRNEKKGQIALQDIFPNGAPTEEWMESAGAQLLGRMARSYISYMRGENPQVFPVRLTPLGIEPLEDYPRLNPRGEPIRDSSFMRSLPIVPVEYSGDALAVQTEMLESLPEGEGGLGTFTLGPIIQAGTLIVPGSEDLVRRTKSDALGLRFSRSKVGGELTWKATAEGGAAWLALGQLEGYGPKIAAAIRRINSAAGICFLFSRFVSMGAVPIALALEANGYTPYKRMSGRLANGIQGVGGRQCALCVRREADHAGAGHEFKPAKYVLLTGDAEISPRNDEMIKAAKDAANKDGGIIKVIVGSDVASEGVDLRFVREIHILESWYHLNKIEQVVGRGIRTCSHTLLPPKDRNCTVYMYAGVMPKDYGRESADLYSYRYAYNKGRQIGLVSRVMKMYAVDCNLNLRANMVNGEDPVEQRDAQGNPRIVELNDQPFSSLCDYMETCQDKCVPMIKVDRATASLISYDEYSSRFLDAQLKRIIAKLFANRGWWREDLFRTALGDIPISAKNYLLRSVIDNPNFKVVSNGREGYILHRNGYYVFQPSVFKSSNIPIALRVAHLPLRPDSYSAEYIAAIRKTLAVEDGAAAAVPEEATTQMTSQKLQQLFTQLESWAESLGSEDANVPSEIYDWFTNKDRGNMLRWFATALRLNNIEGRDRFMRDIAMQMAYDEECSPEEQQLFFTSEELRPLGARLSPEQFLNLDGRPVFASVDITNGQINYTYTDGSIVAPADRKTLEGGLEEESLELRKSRNPNFGLKANKTTTSDPYGFIVAKRGLAFVFKTNTPPAPGGTVKIGSECAIVSNMVDHARLIGDLGKQLKASLGTDLYLDATPLDNKKYEFQKYFIYEGEFATADIVGMRPDEIKKTRMMSANKVCLVMNTVLRFMDMKRIGGLRHFYRSVPAVVTGHKGTFRIKK